MLALLIDINQVPLLFKVIIFGYPQIYFCPKNSVMSVLFILIGASLLLAICFLAGFILSVRSGQYDDDYTPSVRILFDDIKEPSSNKKKN